ncbi:MAG: energy transducer TonB [Spirochaetia bacterium]|nr:energy transducer TonB [Spirochaetia bacterium]
MVYPAHTEIRWYIVSLLLHISLFALISLSLPEVAPAPAVRGSDERITLRVDLTGRKVKTAPAEEIQTEAAASDKAVAAGKAEVADTVTDKRETEISGVVSGDEVFPSASVNNSSGGGISGEEDSDFTKAKILTPLSPVYPRYAVRRGIEGNVLLDADIDPAGTPFKVDIFKSSGHTELDKAAVDSVRDARFLPARYRGKEISDRLRIAVNFTLKDYR